MTRHRFLIKLFSYIFLIITSFVMAYPVLFMALGAFTTNERFLEVKFLPIPNTLNLELFSHAFYAVQDAYLLTFIRVLFYVTLTLLVGLIGGYIFSKLHFPGKHTIFLMFLMGMVMPTILMIVPMYLLAAWLPFAGGNDFLGRGGHGFIGEWPVLFMFGWVSPLAIFLLKQSYDMLTKEYEDAAKVDGAGILTIIFRVYAPLLKPPIAALVVITFLTIWNDYLWPSLAITGSPDYYPIAFKIQGIGLRVSSSVGLSNYPAAMVLYFMATWPPALVYFLLQRFFIQGVVASGLKG